MYVSTEGIKIQVGIVFFSMFSLSVNKISKFCKISICKSRVSLVCVPKGKKNILGLGQRKAKLAQEGTQ